MGFEVIPSEEIAHRTDFSLLCNARGYLDAVEVGTDQGVFARDFLSRFAGNWLFLVDPYAPCPEFEVDRSLDAMTAVLAMMPYHGRFRFVRHPSPAAVPFVCSLISPQFVYIDGDHTYEAVKADIEAWFSILPEDGCIGGHDFDDGHPGVKRAVEEFARERDLVVRLTSEPFPSWYCYKGGEPERLFVRLFREAEEANPRHPGAGA